MAGFEDLPFEVLDSICTHLRNLCGRPAIFPNNRGSKKALASLCLTSKKFFHVALPHLYHYIRCDSDKARIDAFATLFLQHKHLAELVHELHIIDCYNTQYTDWLFDHIYAQTRLVDLEISGRSNGVDWRNDPVPYVARVLDQLFTQLSNVRLIELNPEIDGGSGHFDIFRQRHVNDVNFLPVLEELSIRHCHTEDGFSLSFALPLISVTKIQRLSLYMCIGVGMRHLYDSTFPSVRELRIEFSSLDQEDFGHLVRLCPNLELLSYGMGDKNVTDYCESVASAYEITRALRTLENTLRTLSLTQYGVRSDELVSRPISSLTGFSKLEHLIIWLHDLTDDRNHRHSDDDEDGASSLEEEPQGNIQGHNHNHNHKRHIMKPFLPKLPKSLKSLYIQIPHGENSDSDSDRDWVSFSDELCRLASATAETDFPNLKAVTIDKKLNLQARFRRSSNKVKYRELIREPPLQDIVEMERIAMAC